jgi:signal transduction histidine kinase
LFSTINVTADLRDELRTVFIFQFLTDEQLDALCSNGSVHTVGPGPVAREGEPASFFYVFLDGGEVVATKRSGGRDVELHRTSELGTYFGAISSSTHVHDVTVRMTLQSRLFVVEAESFARFTQSWWPIAMHLLDTSVARSLSQRQLLGLQERQHALATMTAGLTHQLNNPAAATVRAVADLRDSMAESDRNLRALAMTAPEALGDLLDIRASITSLVATPSPLSPLETADREEALDDWLARRGIADSWRYTSTFVDAGFDEEWLERIETAVTAATLECAVSWIKQFVDTEMRVREISEAGARIATLVNGVKPYSQMDRGPYQCIDIHEMLRSTVLMFGDKIAMADKGKPITLVKDLDFSLPEIHCYPADLNQVWTNLISNALYAMDGHGTLTVRTLRDGDAMVRVEICDDGPGIPQHILGRIFDPFFTTKPVGSGSGLGLDLAWRVVVNRHHGHITVQSEPGDTRFIVCLPLEAPAPDPG